MCTPGPSAPAQPAFVLPPRQDLKKYGATTVVRVCDVTYDKAPLEKDGITVVVRASGLWWDRCWGVGVMGGVGWAWTGNVGLLRWEAGTGLAACHLPPPRPACGCSGRVMLGHMSRVAELVPSQRGPGGGRTCRMHSRGSWSGVPPVLGLCQGEPEARSLFEATAGRCRGQSTGGSGLS